MSAFSVVIPVHNEEKLLPLALPSVLRLEPTEVIVLLDRCSDNSEKLVKEISTRFGIEDKIVIVNIDREDTGFKFRSAFLRVFGCGLASCNIVLVADADLVIDPKIKDYINQVDSLGFISFEYKDFPVNPRHQIKRILGKFLPFNWLGGVKLFRRDMMFLFEDMAELKTLASQDTHLADAFRKHGYGKYVMSNTIHLRPKEDKDRHVLRGRLYARYGRGLALTILSGVCMLRFGVIKGYIKEKFGEP